MYSSGSNPQPFRRRSGVTERTMTLYSEGTRISVDMHLPSTPRPAAGFPAILLCHGWGGLKHQLVYIAEAFARAGFAAMTFDYRGWGESDGRVIARKDAPSLLTAEEITLEVRGLRELRTRSTRPPTPSTA